MAYVDRNLSQAKTIKPKQGKHAMISNIGKTERLMRIFIGSLFIGWGIFFGARLGIVMFALGIGPLTTGLIGNCPLYTAFKYHYLRDYNNQ